MGPETPGPAAALAAAGAATARASPAVAASARRRVPVARWRRADGITESCSEVTVLFPALNPRRITRAGVSILRPPGATQGHAFPARHETGHDHPGNH